MTRQYITNTGFSKRPSLPQISSYLVFSLQTIVFYALMLPNFTSLAYKIFTGILFTLTLLFLVISTAISGCTDPSDPIMKLYLSANNQIVNDMKNKPNNNLSYCDHCRSYVKESSRHCKVCDRCTDEFDHHCMWVNNCIGKENYRPFAVMIGSTFANLAAYIIAVVLITVQGQYSMFLGKFGVSWAMGIIAIVFFVLVTNLIILHIYLACKGITTYQFILAQRRQAMEEQAKAELKKRQTQKLKLQQLQAKKIAEESEGIQIKNQNQHDNTMAQEQILKKASPKHRETLDQIIFIKSNSDQAEEEADGNMNFNSKDTDSIDMGIQQRFQQIVDVDQTEKSDQSKRKPEQQLKEPQKYEDFESDQNNLRISKIFMKNPSLKLMIGASQTYRHNKSAEKEDAKSKSYYVESQELQDLNKHKRKIKKGERISKKNFNKNQILQKSNFN